MDRVGNREVNSARFHFFGNCSFRAIELVFSVLDLNTSTDNVEVGSPFVFEVGKDSDVPAEFHLGRDVFGVVCCIVDCDVLDAPV
jgi:hypothetical protein